MNNTKEKIFVTLLCFLFLMGALRFFYSTSFKHEGILTTETYLEKKIDSLSDPDTLERKRTWGPSSKLLYDSIEKYFPNIVSTALIWRLILFLSFFFIIYYTNKIMNDFRKLFNKKDSLFWSLLLVFAFFQSSGAIYEIKNGGGEIILGLTLIGNFYYYYKKKFFIASLFIIFGIFFKITPLIFLFPYFVYSLISKDGRKYIYYLLCIGLFFSIISYPVQGFFLGSLYPISILINVLDQTTSNPIPIWSLEVFNPLSLINKIIYGFQLDKAGINISGSLVGTAPIYDIPRLTLFISKIFFLFLFIILLLSSFFLKVFYHNEKMRLFYLLVFQNIIGYTFFIFGVDFSIGCFVLIVLNIFFPLFFISILFDDLSKIRLLDLSIVFLYIVGLSLIGNLIPISFLEFFIPYVFFDNLTNYETTKIIGSFGSYNWYAIPLFGISLIFLCFIFLLKIFNKKNS